MARATRKAATSTDVARLAGVSRATVSYVLNAVPDSRIPDETRDRVLAAVTELGYSPSAAARSLRAGQTDLIVFPTARVPMGALAISVLDRLAGNFAAEGLTLLLHAGIGPRGTAAHWAELRPAAVICDAGRCTAADARLLANAGVPTLILINDEPVDYATTVLFNQREVGVRAAEYLLARGHRRLAAVLVASYEDFSRPRADGFVATSASAGARADLVELGDTPDAAAAVARRWAADPDRPTAVLAYNDEYAMMLIRALQDAGLSVPGDIAVMGVDDLPLCEMIRPRLTTVAFDWPAWADVVSSTVVALIRDQTPPGDGRAIRCGVVARESA